MNLKSFLFIVVFVADCSAESKLENKIGNTDPVKSSPEMPPEEPDEALYEKVFGKVAHQKEMLLEFNVFLDKEKIGEIEALVGDKCKVFAKSLQEILEDYIVPEVVNKIDSLKDKDGFVNFDDLAKLSLNMKLNRLILQIEISADVKIKKKRTLGRRDRDDNVKQNVKQAKFSGFVNARIQNSINRERVGGSVTNRNIVLNHAINLYGVVFEGSVSQDHSSRSKEKSRFRRDNSTLVYNFVDTDSFIRFGDIFSDSMRYQNVPEMFGLKIKKGAESGYESDLGEPVQITLLRQSTVTVYVNGNIVKKLENVAAGTYTIDDLNIADGSNDIRIEIVDEVGQKQVLDQSFFMKRAFTAKGQYSLNLSAGYPKSEGNSQKRYDKQNKIISGSIVYGLLHATEIEFGTQRSNDGQSYATGIRNGNILGDLDFHYARSNYHDNKDSLSGNAIYLQYSTPSINIFKEVTVGLRASIEKTSSFFYPYMKASQVTSQISSLLKQQENFAGKNISKTGSLYVSNLLSLSFNFNYSTRKRTDNKKESSFSCNVYKSITFSENSLLRSGNINLFFEKNKASDGVTSKIFGISLSLSLDHNIDISSGVERHGNEKSLYTSFHKRPYGDGFGYDASVFKSKNSRNYELKTDYSNSAFKADLSHSRNNRGSNTTRIGGESTLFFADGNFAIGRHDPSDGGFVIATPRKALKNERLSFSEGQIRSNLFGGAAIPVSRNSTTTTRLDLTKLSDNVDVKQDTIIAHGEYKRGATIDISAEGSVTARGVLLSKDNEPLKLATGYAIHKTDKNAKPAYFFTNPSGKFIITDLKAGTYKVTVSVEGIKDFEINVKDSSKNSVIDLGTIICEEE